MYKRNKFKTLCLIVFEITFTTANFALLYLTSNGFNIETCNCTKLDPWYNSHIYYFHWKFISITISLYKSLPLRPLVLISKRDTYDIPKELISKFVLIEIKHRTRILFVFLHRETVISWQNNCADFSWKEAVMWKWYTLCSDHALGMNESLMFFLVFDGHFFLAYHLRRLDDFEAFGGRISERIRSPGRWGNCFRFDNGSRHGDVQSCIILWHWDSTQDRSLLYTPPHER